MISIGSDQPAIVKVAADRTLRTGGTAAASIDGDSMLLPPPPSPPPPDTTTGVLVVPDVVTAAEDMEFGDFQTPNTSTDAVETPQSMDDTLSGDLDHHLDSAPDVVESVDAELETPEVADHG